MQDGKWSDIKMGIYKELVKAIGERAIFNHEEDLYCEVNEVTRQVIEKYRFKDNVECFYNVESKRWMYCISMAYEPYVYGSQMPVVAKKKRKQVEQIKFRRIKQSIIQKRHNDMLFILRETKTERIEVTIFPFDYEKGIVYSVIPAETVEETIREVYKKLMDNFKKRKEF